MAALLFAPGIARAQDTVSIALGDPNTSTPANGLTQIEQDMGFTTAVTQTGSSARSTAPPSGKTGQYLYLTTADSFIGTPGSVKELYVTVRYFDSGTDSFQLEYDATKTPTTDDPAPDPANDDPVADIHRVAGSGLDVVHKTDTKTWLTHTFHLTDVYFGKREEGGANLRINDLTNDADGNPVEGEAPEIISSVSVSKTNPIHLNIPQIATPPTLDGKLDEPYWKTTDNLVRLCSGAQDVIRPTVWTGPDDYCADFHYAWDNNALYVSADVIDDVPRNNDQLCGDEYGADGFEVFWGFDQSNPSRTQQIDGEDFHWFVSAPPAGTPATWAYQTTPGNADVELPNGDCSSGNNVTIVDRADGKSGYIMEFQMPWSEWKSHEGVSHAPPKAGQLIGFTMFGNDGDVEMPNANGMTYDQEIAFSWANIPGPSGHPNAWLTIQLGGLASAATLGDLNGDSKINVQDATLSLRIAVGSLTPTDAQKTAGDVNHDGKWNVQDTTLILRRAVGAITAFP